MSYSSNKRQIRSLNTIAINDSLDLDVRYSTARQMITTHDRFGLVLVKVDGVLYEIVDIGMRMLEPHELYAAQGFPSNYIIKGYNVNGKPVTKSDQVARCGNSVPPVFAEALVRANMPEHWHRIGTAVVVRAL